MEGLNQVKIYLVVCGDYDEKEVLCAYHTKELATNACYYLRGMGGSRYADSRVEETVLADTVEYVEKFR